ncbi:MAG: hypothetical protein TR69_WS6001001273 [candidate division WS6 bacterium OLB20]|uniref:Uncharacterized protein n=1 Tax=candidate division WS6 bacterium OLB20 TaxID=1617426 RepID=A0A136LWE0_9BACT|nr:MAG: hypothetical protein TR69_WS6001001273 [candidate division WS6 bacterium OLB20]
MTGEPMRQNGPAFRRKEFRVGNAGNTGVNGRKNVCSYSNRTRPGSATDFVDSNYS